MMAGQWEYRIIPRDGSLAAALNELGAEGWECFAVDSRAYLKRPLPAAEGAPARVWGGSRPGAGRKPRAETRPLVGQETG